MIPKKTFGTLLLLLMICIYVLRVPFVYLDYQLRKEYIAQYLCVNKSRPITICGGSCYLARQLQKAQDHKQSEKTASVKIPLKEYHKEGALAMSVYLTFYWVGHVFDYQDHYAYLLRLGTFRPPRHT